jgi:PAP2 superfamily
MEIEIMSKDTGTGVGEYPREKWSPEYQDVHEREPDKWLFDPDAVTLTTKPGYAAGECIELLSLELDQRLLWRDKIVTQAQGNNRAIQPVLDVLGFDYASNPTAAEFVDLLMDNVRCLLFRFKVAYGRARPHHKCKTLGPMFMPLDHPLHPGHGSFPAGHAAFAYFWASLLGRATMDQAKRQQMLDEAANVARNRERAGLHFRSDSEAGKELGEKIAAEMWNNRAVGEKLAALLRR